MPDGTKILLKYSYRETGDGGYNEYFIPYSIEDPNGNFIELIYKNGKLAGIRDCLGRIIEFTYNNGTTIVKHPDGSEYRIVWDGNAKKLLIEDPIGRWIKIAHGYSYGSTVNDHLVRELEYFTGLKILYSYSHSKAILGNRLISAHRVVERKLVDLNGRIYSWETFQRVENDKLEVSDITLLIKDSKGFVKKKIVYSYQIDSTSSTSTSQDGRSGSAPSYTAPKDALEYVKIYDPLNETVPLKTVEYRYRQYNYRVVALPTSIIEYYGEDLNYSLITRLQYDNLGHVIYRGVEYAGKLVSEEFWRYVNTYADSYPPSIFINWDKSEVGYFSNKFYQSNVVGYIKDLPAGYATYFYQDGVRVLYEKYYRYDYRGNLVEEKTRLDRGNQILWIKNYYWYDSYGNLIKSRDHLGREVFYEYGAEYGHAYLTEIYYYDRGEKVYTRFGYDFYSGLLLNVSKLVSYLPPVEVSEPVENPGWQGSIEPVHLYGPYYEFNFTPENHYAVTRELYGNATIRVYINKSEGSRLEIYKGVEGNWTLVLNATSQYINTTLILELNHEKIKIEGYVPISRQSPSPSPSPPGQPPQPKPPIKPTQELTQYSTDPEWLYVVFGIEYLNYTYRPTIEKVTKFSYDKVGRLVKVVKPDGSTTRAEYLDFELKARFYDEVGAYREEIYDPLGRIIEERRFDPYGNQLIEASKWGYDELGRTAWTYSAGVNISYVYDIEDRVVKKIRSDGKYIEYIYVDEPSKGYSHGQYGMLPYYTVIDYDGSKKTVAIGPHGTAAVYYGENYANWNYFYNEAGLLSKIVDPLGREIKFYYDNLGRKVKTVYPHGKFEEYWYDSAGNLVKYRDIGGRIFYYVYDEHYRLKEVKTLIGDANVTLKVYSYDLAGRLEKIEHNGTIIEYERDLMDRVIAKTWTIDGTAYTFNYSYDPRGLVKEIVYPDGFTVTYSYDYLGRETEVYIPGIGSFLLNYHQSRGYLTTIHYPNGVTLEYGYDLLNRPNSLAVKKSSEYLLTVALGYTTGGEITRVDVYQKPYGAWSEVYQYDPYHRLIAASGPYGSIVYEYDEVNRIVRVWENGAETAYLYSGWDQPVKIGAAALAYDQADRIISINVNGLETSYRYDYSGRLVEVKGRASFWYDGEDNRIKIL